MKREPESAQPPWANPRGLDRAVEAVADLKRRAEADQCDLAAVRRVLEDIQRDGLHEVAGHPTVEQLIAGELNDVGQENAHQALRLRGAAGK